MGVIKSHNIIITKDKGNFTIKLIPMIEEHLPLLYKWNMKSNVLYWCEGDDVITNSEEDVRNIYGGVSQRALMFIILVDDVPVGECWIQDMNIPTILKKYPHKNIKRIDMTIFEESLWNKGLGRSINTMLVNFGFNMLNADIIYAITEDYNLRAQKCLLKSGFILDSKLEHYQTAKGKYEYCYMIDKEQFLKHD